MKYKIDTCNTPMGLEKDVNLSIEDGWIPLGGVSVTAFQSDDGNFDHTEFRFAQAMTKTEEPYD